MSDRNDDNNSNDDGKTAQQQHDEEMARKGSEARLRITDNDDTRDIDSSDSTDDNNDDSQTDADNKAERPDDIPEKFWDAEKGEVNVQALLKAQQDAESALRKKEQGKESDDDSTDDDSDDNQDAQDNAIEKARSEFAENGELSDDTYKSLEKAGLPKQMVDDYIAGQQAIVGQLQSAAFGEFDGTKESYQEAVKWAADNLSDEEIQALDVQLTSTNPAIVAQGAKALAAKYKENADIEPDTTIQSGGNNSNTGSYFKSSDEMQKAMRDPRYKKDENFRKEVRMKIHRASKANVNLFG